MTDYVTNAFNDELEKLARAGALGTAAGWLAKGKERLTGLASAASAKLQRMGGSLKRGKEVTKPPPRIANLHPDAASQPRMASEIRAATKSLRKRPEGMWPKGFKPDPRVAAEFGLPQNITAGASGRQFWTMKSASARAYDFMFDELERIVGEVAA